MECQPKWAKDTLNNTKDSITAIIKDPMLILEGISQGVSDAVDTKGIAYCTGYAVGGLVGQKGIDKVLKAVKSMGAVSEVAEGIGKASPSEIAQSWQGSFSYVGVDKYKNITLKKGKVIYVGDPYPTGYATTKSAVDKISCNSRKLFEGLQVKPYWEDGMSAAEYRSKMMAYEITEEIDVAFGITKANPQFGQVGYLKCLYRILTIWSMMEY